MKSRSLRQEWQTLGYFSLLYLHGVRAQSSPVWIKSFNLLVPSYTHTLPYGNSYFLPYYNVSDLRLLNFCPFFKCQLGSPLLCETFLEHFRSQIFHFPELLYIENIYIYIYRMHILHLIIELHYTLYQIIPYALAASPQVDFKVLYYFSFQ